MRRAAILALLFLGMQLIIPLGGPGAGSAALLVLGFLVLGAYTVGEMAPALALPRITGFLFAGVLFGPSVLGVVSAEAVDALSTVSRLAVALIAFLAGAELRWRELAARARAIVAVLGTELALGFAAIAGTLMLLREQVDWLRGTPAAEAAALAALFASVAVVHSPAVTMGLLTETGARGPVARTTLGIVLLADVVVVLLFSAVLGAVRAVVPAPGGGPGPSVGLLLWELGGAPLVGLVLGGAIALYLRFVRRELFVFAVVVTFFGAEIARLAHVEPLLTLLVAGFVTENATGEGGRALLHAMERSAAPVFVVFFALAGASIALRDVAAIWPLALAVVAARAGAIFVGCKLGARWAAIDAGAPERRLVWMGLIPQAGVAIGLVTVVADAYPTRGAAMRTLFLSVIAINQLAGPVLARWALAKAGEVDGSSPPPPSTDG